MFAVLKVDILNATNKIAIEVNGPQHEKLHFFHNGSPFNYLEALKNDYKKLQWLEKNGFKVVEIKYNEVDTLTVDFFKEKFDISL